MDKRSWPPLSGDRPWMRLPAHQAPRSPFGAPFAIAAKQAGQIGNPRFALASEKGVDPFCRPSLPCATASTKGKDNEQTVVYPPAFFPFTKKLICAIHYCRRRGNTSSTRGNCASCGYRRIHTRACTSSNLKLSISGGSSCHQGNTLNERRQSSSARSRRIHWHTSNP